MKYISKQKKTQQMKKFFAIAFIAAALVSCGEAAKSDKPATDTTKVVAPVAPTQDTAAKKDSAATPATPTQDTAKKAETK